MATRRAIISVTIEPELLKRLDDLADAQAVPRSQLIETLIRQGIEDEEIAVRAVTNPVILNAFMGAFRDRAVVKAMASAVGDELSPEQLNLFRQAMTALDHTVRKEPAATAAGTPAATPAKKKKQRGKR